MKARTARVGQPLKWFAGVVLVLSTGMLLGGCHGHRMRFVHGPGPYVADHRGPDRVVVVEAPPRPTVVVVPRPGPDRVVVAQAPPRATVVVPRGQAADRRSDRRDRQEARDDRTDRRNDRRSDRDQDRRTRPRRR